MRWIEYKVFKIQNCKIKQQKYQPKNQILSSFSQTNFLSYSKHVLKKSYKNTF